MKKIKFLLSGLLLVLMGCSSESKKENEGAVLSFDATNAVDIHGTSLYSPENIIHLDFADSILVNKNAYLLYDDETFFIYSQGLSSPMMRFDKEGHFLNYVGQIGNGPEEYNLVTDACLNRKNKRVEIVSGIYMYSYQYDGAYLNRLEHQQTAFSFVVDEEGNYWFYLGNNSVNGDAKMVKMDAECHELQEMLEEKSNLLPMVESNFCKGAGLLTFREALSHDLYKLVKGEIEKSYSLDFPKYHLPENLREVPPMDAVSLLRQSNYARVMFYAENQSYLFLQVLLNNVNQEDSEMYYWIHQKSSNKDVVIKFDKAIPVDSYLYYPQFLTEDGKLYFMGFIIEKEDSLGLEENPSIVIVDIKSLL